MRGECRHSREAGRSLRGGGRSDSGRAAGFAVDISGNADSCAGDRLRCRFLFVFRAGILLDRRDSLLVFRVVLLSSPEIVSRERYLAWALASESMDWLISSQLRNGLLDSSVAMTL